MFATLLGGLPAPDPGEASPVEAAIRAQEAAGLEPITDGRLSDPGFGRLGVAILGGDAAVAVEPVAAWRAAAALTDRAVKQSLPGPYSLGRGGAASGDLGRPGADRVARTMACAEALRHLLEALAAAGCPLIEIEETEAHLIGTDESERQLFRSAHAALTDGIAGTHLSLSIVGKAAAAAGIETILAAPYASLAVDLIGGPDNWNLVTRAPGDRGIVVGALGARERADEPKELLLWGAHYAASTGGRGIARVGLGSSGSWEHLTWAAAIRKLGALGRAAHIAAMPPGDELVRSVDPRSISARHAALDRAAKGRPRR